VIRTRRIHSRRQILNRSNTHAAAGIHCCCQISNRARNHAAASSNLPHCQFVARKPGRIRAADVEGSCGRLNDTGTQKGKEMSRKKCKTFSKGDSHVVTHRSTNPSVRSLCMAERTGCPVFCDLWPNVPDKVQDCNIYRGGRGPQRPGRHQWPWRSSEYAAPGATRTSPAGDGKATPPGPSLCQIARLSLFLRRSAVPRGSPAPSNHG
jgi:hypothetical protein